MCAAIGVAQINKLPQFIEIRKRNFRILYDGLKKLHDYFILPESEKYSDPAWFGFPLTIKQNAGFTRNSIVQLLREKQYLNSDAFCWKYY